MNELGPGPLVTPLGITLGVVLGWVTLVALWLGTSQFRVEHPQTFNLITHSAEPALPGVDQPHGPGFYSTTVWFVYKTNGVDVKARINIGPGDGMFQDLGVLATFADQQVAQQTFGQVVWDASGVTIGTGPKTLAVPRSRYQSHR